MGSIPIHPRQNSGVVTARPELGSADAENGVLTVTLPALSEPLPVKFRASHSY